MQGKITWYNDKDGFGIIVSSGYRLYFHASQKELFAANQDVTFDIQADPDSGHDIAVNVNPAE